MSRSTDGPAWISRPAGASLHRAPILLADSDEPTVAVIRHRLERAGLEVEAVDNGPDALAAIRRNVYSAVVSASLLPGLDGIGLLRAIEDDVGEPPPVVLVFWPGNDAAVVRAFEAGAADVIVRPLSITEAGARILRLVRSLPTSA